MVKAVVAAKVGGRIIKQAAAAIATLVVGAIAMVSAMLGVLFGVAVAVFGSSSTPTMLAFRGAACRSITVPITPPPS